METFSQIVTVAQGISAIFTMLFIFLRPFREWVLGVKKTSKAKDDATRSMLRNDIVQIYYKNKNTCQIHAFEYENLVLLYEAYKGMGGNSFVDRIWEEVQEWEIIP